MLASWLPSTSVPSSILEIHWKGSFLADIRHLLFLFVCFPWLSLDNSVFTEEEVKL